jgi:predicted DNA-binding ribbon-helix-helix protein
MTCSLENLVNKPGTLESLESFRLLKLSDETWNSVKQETTAAEFTMAELIWELYESHVDVLNGATDKLLGLSEILKNKLPLEGLDTKDVSWEAVHATVTTLQVVVFQDRSDSRYAVASLFHSALLSPR